MYDHYFLLNIDIMMQKFSTVQCTYLMKIINFNKNDNSKAHKMYFLKLKLVIVQNYIYSIFFFEFLWV